MTKQIYKTAQGKTIDMGKLMIQNEQVRAVGNMKVNARGDTIDGLGKVIVPITEKVNDSYTKTVGNKSAQVKNSIKKNTKPIIKEVLTPQELELENSFEDDLEVEKIKAKEMSKNNGK